MIGDGLDCDNFLGLSNRIVVIGDRLSFHMAWSCGYTPRAQILRTLIDVDVVVENRELALLNYCSRHLNFTHSSRLLLLFFV